MQWRPFYPLVPATPSASVRLRPPAISAPVSCSIHTTARKTTAQHRAQPNITHTPSNFPHLHQHHHAVCVCANTHIHQPDVIHSVVFKPTGNKQDLHLLKDITAAHTVMLSFLPGREISADQNEYRALKYGKQKIKHEN